MTTPDSGLTLGGCHIGRTAVLFPCLYIILVANSVVWALDPGQLYDKHKYAVVKIHATGTLSSGKRSDPNAYVGSGFIIYSGPLKTVILTAAHVIGKKSEWDQENGAPKRKVSVKVLNEHGTLVDLVPVDVFDQPDNQDWAILHANGTGYSCLNVGDPLKFSPGDTGVLMGYESDSEVPGVATGTATTATTTYGPILRINNMNVINGQSGGPILDENGQVVGIASGNEEGGKHGVHIAVPISLPSSSLQTLLPPNSFGKCKSGGPPVSPTADPEKNGPSIHNNINILAGRWYGVFREYDTDKVEQRLTHEQVDLTVTGAQITGKSYTPGREWQLSGYYKEDPKNHVHIMILHYFEVDPSVVSLGSMVVEGNFKKNYLQGYWVGHDRDKEDLVACPYVLTRDKDFSRVAKDRAKWLAKACHPEESHN